MKLWNAVVQANDGADFALALALLAALPGAVALVRRLALRLLDRSASGRWNGVPAAMVRATNLWVLLPAVIYAAVLPLELPDRLDRVATLGAVIALLVQGGVWASSALAAWLELR